MQVTVEEVNSTRRKLAIEVPLEAVMAELDRAFGRVQRDAKLKGFRPGKAPRAVLERYFGEQIRADVLSHLIEHSYSDALKEAGLRPVGPPEIVPEDVASGKPLRYSATVDVLPKIEIGEHEALPAKRPRRTVGEADVDRAVERLRESLAELRPVEDREEIRPGDFVMLDYHATADGKTMAGGKRENRLIELGKGALPEEMERALVGAKLGETKSVDITYPAEHPDASLAGKTVQVEVTPRGIRDKILPDADDELAKEHGECATFAELREKLREQIEQSYRREGEELVRDQVVAELVKRNQFDVPRSLVDRQVDAFVEDLVSRLGERRAELERDVERLAKLREDYRGRGEHQVRAVLALDALASQLGIEIPEEEVDKRVTQLASQAGEQGARVREYYGEEAARADLRARLARERALDRVVAAATVEEVTEEPAAAASDIAPTGEKG
jgi:trigger factor